MTFIGDQGKDYLTARDMVLTNQPALVGIASSVPWLYQGPFFIWLLALVFKLTGFNPIHPAILTAVLGVLTVYLVYKFSHSRLAALIMAASPLAVVHSRLAYHISPIPLFSILYLFALQNLSVGWTFFLAGNERFCVFRSCQISRADFAVNLLVSLVNGFGGIFFKSI